MRLLDLNRELIIARMRKALKDIPDIDVPEARVNAYEKIGVPTEQIIELDTIAFHLELKRREVMLKPDIHMLQETSIGKRLAEDFIEIIALAIFLAGIASAFLVFNPGA